MLNDVLSVGLYELSPDRHQGSYSGVMRYIASRYNELRSNFRRANELNPDLKKAEMAKGLGLGALLAFQYSPGDELLLTKVGLEALSATGKPLIAAATVGVVNFGEHYLAGKLANNLDSLTPDLIIDEVNHADGNIKRRGILGRYARSLAFGAGVDILWQKLNGHSPENSYPAKSAGVIATTNTLLALGIAAGAEKLNVVENLRDNVPAIALGIGYLVVTTSVIRDSIPKRHSATEAESTL